MSDAHPQDAHPPRDAACAEVMRRAFEFLDGELPEDASRVVQEHIARCIPCRRHVESDAAFLRMLARPALVERCPDALRQRLTAALIAREPLRRPDP